MATKTPARRRRFAANTPRARRIRWTEAAPFHVVSRHLAGTLLGYDIYCKNRRFLRHVRKYDDLGAGSDLTPPLTRPQVYAIVRLLNGEQAMRKWADRFGDPYVG